MKRLALSLLLLLSLACTAKESSPTEFWADNGAKRVSVLPPKDGRTVLRFQMYAGNVLTDVRVIPAEKCVVFSPTTWSCAEGRIVVDGDFLFHRRDGDPSEQMTYARVHP